MEISGLATLNAQARAFLQRAREAGRRPFFELSVDEARALYEASCQSTQFSKADNVSTTELSIEGPGQSLRIKLYTPLQLSTDRAPGVVFAHGGGWVLGSFATHDAICRLISSSLKGIVVAVDYRRAPEHPFPAGFEDVLAAYRFVIDHAYSLRIDPDRLALFGDSAGGALIASVALAIRDNGASGLQAQVLFYPVTDLSSESAGYTRVSEGPILTAQTMRWFRELYTPQRDDRHDWRASPHKAGSLRGAAPALVITAAHDPLCEEGTAYARRLEQASVPTILLHLGDQMHAFLSMGGIIPSARVPLDFAIEFLRGRLDSTEKGENVAN